MPSSFPSVSKRTSKAAFAAISRATSSAASRAQAPSTNAVLYTAHYDHLGIDPDAKGDNVYNGAADNGTGCWHRPSGYYRAFARVTRLRPPHTGVYFAQSPRKSRVCSSSQYLGMPTPFHHLKISLDLNFDMLLPIGIPRSVNSAVPSASTSGPPSTPSPKPSTSPAA